MAGWLNAVVLEPFGLDDAGSQQPAGDEFEYFSNSTTYRTDDPTTRTTNGNGLQLLLTRQIRGISVE